MPQDPAQTAIGQSMLKLLLSHPDGLTTAQIADRTSQTISRARIRLYALGGKGWVRLQPRRNPLVWMPSEKLIQTELGYKSLERPKNVP